MNVSATWGLRWKALQIRPTVDLDKPERFAMDARDQWVALSGVLLQCIDCDFFYLPVSNSRRAPGTRLIDSPSTRIPIKRLRHFPTVLS